MSHLSEEDLVLHYYGDGADAIGEARHLDECAECRERLQALSQDLADAALEVPARGEDYGERVWLRIADRLPERRGWFELPRWRWAMAGLAFAGLMAMAFLAGRSYPGAGNRREMAAAELQQRQSVLLVAMGDYLERSQMVLIELANADPAKPLDISAEQERAGMLVSEARLYRQTALHTGDKAVAGLLDDLERTLVDLTHEPSELSPARLEEMRERMRSQGILMKVRVMGKHMEAEQDAGASAGARRL